MSQDLNSAKDDLVVVGDTGSARSGDRQARRVVLGALVGTSLEWYDFFLFGTASALVFNTQYFADGNSLTAVLSSFATFAVGFVARPIGGVVFGRMGDRVGRRATLLVTISLIGLATGLIGLLPNYAAIGVWAPICLTTLRFIQGLALGGEWAGAIVMTGEHAPADRRVFYTALPLIGSPIGTLLSSFAFIAVGLLPGESFDAWGWRIPFVLALGLMLVAIYIRRTLEESPVYRRLVADGERESAPVAQVLRTAWRRVIIGAMASVLGMGGAFLVSTFAISYLKRELHRDSNMLLGATLLAAAGEIFVIAGFGYLAQRVGAVRVAAGGAIASAVIAFPVFWLYETGSYVLIFVAMTAAYAALSTPYAVCGSLMSCLYPDSVRYTGVALSANAAAVVSGFIPLLATWFYSAAGNQIWTAGALFLGMSLLTLAGVLGVARISRAEGPGRV